LGWVAGAVALANIIIGKFYFLIKIVLSSTSETHIHIGILRKRQLRNTFLVVSN
jgi:hypothetical protein